MSRGWKSPELTPAEKRAKERYERGLRAIAEVMASPQGRTALRHLLLESKVFDEALWSATSAETHRNAAIRDFGMGLMRDMQRANPAAWQAMYQEQLREENEEFIQRKKEEEIA